MNAPLRHQQRGAPARRSLVELRHRMEEAIDRLICALDALDATDADMEPDNDLEKSEDSEPGGAAPHKLDQRAWSL
jgi:hypothetical protein